MVRQNQPPGSTAGAITSVIIGAIAFVIGLMFVGTYLGLKKLLGRAYRFWRNRREPQNAVAVGDGNAATSVGDNPVTALQNPASPTLLADEKDGVRPAELKRVDLKGAYLSIRFYENGGVAKAKLTIVAKAVQKRIGSPTLQLDDRQVTSMAQAVMEFKAEAEERMSDDGSKARRAPIPVVNDGTKDVVEKTPPTVPAPVPVSQDQEPKIEAPPRKKLTSRKQISYRGVLIDSGLAPRNQGDRSFNQFRVLLHDDKLGGELPLWGADLERVLQETGVKPGDRIEASIVGDTEVLIKGNPRSKTIWAISKM